jgi:hypothetical protein
VFVVVVVVVVVIYEFYLFNVICACMSSDTQLIIDFLLLLFFGKSLLNTHITLNQYVAKIIVFQSSRDRQNHVG